MLKEKIITSIIIPIYNTEKYIEKCLDSIIEQSYSNMEIILVDDGSTDTSVSIAEKYESKDSRFQLIKQSNMGASTARNTGLDAARGDYIMFVDSDDWIDANMVEELVNQAENINADLVISQVPCDKTFSNSMTIDKMEALPILLNGAWWGPVGKLFKRSAIEHIRFPKATISEDYVFMLHTILNCESIAYMPKCFYHREVREGSLSRLAISERKFEEFENVSYVANYIREHYPQFRRLAEARQAESSLKLLFAIYGSKKESEFAGQRNILTQNIRRNILEYLPNGNILLKSRLLLGLCSMPLGGKCAYYMYHTISQ